MTTIALKHLRRSYFNFFNNNSERSLKFILHFKDNGAAVL